MSDEHSDNGWRSLLPELPTYYTVAEATAALRIGKSTLYRNVPAGRLKLIKLGVKTVFHRDDLARLIALGSDYDLAENEGRAQRAQEADPGVTPTRRK